MREIKDEDIRPLEKKIGKLSMDMVSGKIKSANELARKIEDEFSTSEDRIFALTLLIINRYIQVTDNILENIKKSDKDVMFG